MDNAITQSINGDFGYNFVGSYLNQCARVEAWTVKVLQPEVDKAKSKMPHLFGQKLKAVRELIEQNRALFSKPSRVSELMQRFEEPAKLRSSLAHAMSFKVNAPAPIANFYLFYTSATDERILLTEDEMSIALAELKKLVKEICDQQLKKPTQPPSQPQPSPGAAAGP